MEASILNAGEDFADIPDRRGTSRFPLREAIKYTVLHSRTQKTSGTGKTLNFGGRGILFTTDERLPLGRVVELSVNWPARLGGTCPLQFVATGRVVRSEAKKAAVRLDRYEFKTRRGPAAAGAGASPRVGPGRFSR
jgi:hypothetical protein